MNRLTREVFVERTQELLLRHGGSNISLSSVLDACRANKGSLYHFFPNGKEELLTAAMEKQAECVMSSNRSFVANADTTSEAVFQLVKSLAKMVDSENCPEFLPFAVAGVIADEGDSELRSVCVKTLESLETLYTDSLVRDGLPRRSAKPIASMVISTIEGALSQARTRQTSVPLKHAASHLREYIASQVRA
ncbi:MAG: TetR/AcrR family transcriptional regulator [Planctomycetota bacterium]